MKGLSPLHADGVIKTAAAGVVDEKGSEYILSHTGPRELDGGVCGSGLVPSYTTLSVRVRANIKFGVLKIKIVRTTNETPPVCVPAVLGALAVWRLSTKKKTQKFWLKNYHGPKCVHFNSLLTPRREWEEEKKKGKKKEKYGARSQYY